MLFQMKYESFRVISGLERTRVWSTVLTMEQAQALATVNVVFYKKGENEDVQITEGENAT